MQATGSITAMAVQVGGKQAASVACSIRDEVLSVWRGRGHGTLSVGRSGIDIGVERPRLHGTAGAATAVFENCCLRRLGDRVSDLRARRAREGARAYSRAPPLFITLRVEPASRRGAEAAFRAPCGSLAAMPPTQTHCAIPYRHMI